MARVETRIRTAIWDDPEYRDLGVDAQWLYKAVLSQKDLSACGVLTWAPGRFARLSRTMTKRRAEEARRELQRRRYVVVDDDTDELWVRTFLKWDGVLDVPNMVVSMTHAFMAVHSEPIRQGLIEQLTPGFYQGLVERFPKEIPKGLIGRLAEGFRRQLGEPLPAGTRAGAFSLLPTPFPPEVPHGAKRNGRTVDGDAEIEDFLERHGGEQA